MHITNTHVSPRPNYLSPFQVYDNEFVDCEGSIKVMIKHQGSICGNTCDEGNCDPFG